MFFLHKDIIDSLQKFKPRTIRNIDSNTKRIYKHVFNTDTFNQSLLNDVTSITSYVDTIQSTGSRKVIMSALLNVVKILFPSSPLESIYKDLFKKYSKIHKREYQYRIQDSYHTLYSLHSKEYKMTSHRKGLRLVVSSLYKYLPPLRGQDFYTLVIKSKEDSSHTNYVDIHKWIIVLNEYKTHKTYGRRTINIPDPLKEIIANWIDYKSLTDGNPLLPSSSSTHKHLTQSSFTGLLNRMYGKGISTDILRRTYISEMIEYFKEHLTPIEAIEMRKKLADIVGHSLEAQEFTYSSYRLSNNMPKSPKEFLDEIYSYFIYSI